MAAHSQKINDEVKVLDSTETIINPATKEKQLPDDHNVTVSNQPSDYPLPAGQVTTLTPQTDALTDVELRATPVPISGSTNILDAEGGSITVQNPFPVDGDSVYEKDLDIPNSDIGTFTGDIESLFNSYYNEITDITVTNPKTYTLRFKRPVTSNKIGIGSLTSNFSNVKFLLKDLAGTVRQTIDESSDSTKYTSNIYEFTINTFIEVVIEFHTADAVKINGMFIPKSQSCNITSIDGIVSSKNSSQTPLGGGAVFTGEMEDTKNYGMLQVALYADVAGVFEIQFRSTPTSTWRTGDTYAVSAGEDKVWSFQASRRFMRVIYTNGGSDQGAFDLQTILKPVYVKPSSHPIGGVVKANDDAELVKSQITGERPDGDFGNVAVTNGNNLKFSLEEYDDAFNTDPLPIVQTDSNGRKVILDNKFKVPVQINIEHHEIHEGDSFERHVDSANSSVATMNVAFKTAPGTKLAHIIFGHEMSDEIFFEILEGASWTQGSGTALPCFNLNRELDFASTVILEDKNQAIFTASQQVVKDATGIAGGAVIENQYSYNAGLGSSKTPETREGAHEWVLKPDTTYIVRMTETSGNCKMTIDLHWYEHTNE